MSRPSSLLFITSSCLGDAVLTTGVLSYLIEKTPTLDITIACGAVPAPLFEGIPRLKQCLPIQRLSFSRHWFRLWQEVYKEQWTFIVDLRGTALSFFLGCKENRWIWKSFGKQGHQVERIAQVLNLSEVPSPRLWTTFTHEKEAVQLLKKYQTIIAIAPASNWIPKTWPLSYWKKLIQDLTSPQGLFPGAAILVMGAAHERFFIEGLLEMLPDVQWINTIGRVSLLTLSACLRHVKLFIGNDSGLMHLAAASGALTVGLFGPTDASQYGPWGHRTIVAHAPEAWQTLRHEAEKNPSISAMMTLSVERVLEKISRLLSTTVVDSAINL